MDEPFVLCSQAASEKGRCRVSSVAYPSRSNQHKRVCVAVPGVGATFYDQSDQTAVSALTLGPSFLPTAPLATRSKAPTDAALSKARFTRITYAAVENAGRNEIWVWSEEEKRDGSVVSDAHRTTLPGQSDRVIRQLKAPRSLPDHLLALTEDGTFEVLLEADASVATRLSPPSAADTWRAAGLEVVPVLPDRNNLLTPTLKDLLPSTHKAHFAFITRTNERPTKQSKKGKSARSTDGADAACDTHIELLFIDPRVVVDGEENLGVVSLGSVKVPARNVSVTEDGFISYLVGNELVTKRMVLSPTSCSAYAAFFDAPHCEVALKHEDVSVKLSDKHLVLGSARLYGLHASFVLLTAQDPRASNDDKTVHVLVWDVRTSSLCASQSLVYPGNAISSTDKSLHCELDRLDRQTTSLVLSPATGKGRSVVSLIPLSLPTMSTLAAAIGKQDLERKFVLQEARARPYEIIVENLLPEEKDPDPHYDRKEADRNAARAKLLSSLRQLDIASAADRDEIDRLFVQYLDEDNKRSAPGAIPSKAGDAQRSEKYLEAEKAIEKAIKAGQKKGKSVEEVLAGEIAGVSRGSKDKYLRLRQQHGKDDKHDVDKLDTLSDDVRWQHVAYFHMHFIGDLIDICFPDAFTTDLSKQPMQHPRRITKYMIDNFYLSESDFTGGVVQRLLRLGDWDMVATALARVPDIEAETTAAVLKKAVQALSTSTTGMTLPAFLARYLDQPFTSSELRPVFRKLLSPEEALLVLHILDNWLARSAAAGCPGGRQLRPDFVIDPYEPDAPVAWSPDKPPALPPNIFHALLAEPPSVPSDGVPLVDDILPIAEALLDAHFVNLLLLRDAHPVLASLEKHIAQHLRVSQDLASLSGILSIYSKEWEKLKPRTRPNKKERHRKKDRREAADQEQDYDAQEVFRHKMANRVNWSEKHSEPGLYALERLHF